MTKIDDGRVAERLGLGGLSGGLTELIARQRRFEWDLARDMQTRVAGQFVAGKTHDLLNLLQIVQLASLELSRRCGADSDEFIADILKAADDAKDQLAELMAVARPHEVIAPGAPVGAVLGAAVETVRATSTIQLDLRLAASPEVTTRCSAAELTHLIYGLALDAIAGGGMADPPSPSDPPDPIELLVRERMIDGKPWLEIVRGVRIEPDRADRDDGDDGDDRDDGEHFDLRAVEAIAVKNGGELARSERRGGGTEVIVALPLVGPAARSPGSPPGSNGASRSSPPA